jgi:tetratricopeptide (TPR) repeat protein
VRLRQRGNCTEALAHFRKAIATYPKYGEAFTEMGNCLKQAGNLTEAENAFKSAIEYSRTVYASINLADMYVSQHRFAEAQRVIRTATKLDPLDGDLFFALARTYFDQNQMKEAEASALEAHSRVHRFPEVHLLLSKIYLANGNQPALLTQLETYLEESPKGPAADQVRQDISRIKAGR